MLKNTSVEILSVQVNVILPIHNNASTIEESVRSAMRQVLPSHLFIPNLSPPYYEINKFEYDGHYGENIREEFNHVYKKFGSYYDGYPRYPLNDVYINITVCGYDDGSTDESYHILQRLKCEYENVGVNNYHNSMNGFRGKIFSHLVIGSSKISHGAGYARNRAVELSKHVITKCKENGHIYTFLCFLDADDIMHPYRVAEQLSVFLCLNPTERHVTLLGCTFSRLPADATWHYTQWANSLEDGRLKLERFREVTIIQPTWFMCQHRFMELGGYIESCHIDKIPEDKYGWSGLILSKYDNSLTIRLAEDLRLFHAHLSHSSTSHNCCFNRNSNFIFNDKLRPGKLKLLRTNNYSLVIYRHRHGISQSSSTPRNLLYGLRAMALEVTVLRRDPRWLTSNRRNWDCDKGSKYCSKNNIKKGGFVIWGAGRDGRQFYRSLTLDVKNSVRCFVDVDNNKIRKGYYTYDKGITAPRYRVPIVHFSYLAKKKKNNLRQKLVNAYLTAEDDKIGRVKKGSMSSSRYVEDLTSKCVSFSKISEISINQEEKTSKRVNRFKWNDSAKVLHNLHCDDLPLLDELEHLPVIVCVAMHRTRGMLEKNINSIGRREGLDLWHFC